jgi:hypothetical protein
MEATDYEGNKKRKRSPKEQKRSQRRANARKKKRKQEAKELFKAVKEFEEDSSYKISSLDVSPKIPVVLEGLRVGAVLDSGSSINLISRELADRLVLRGARESKLQALIKGASSSSCVENMIEVRLSWAASATEKVKLLVLNDSNVQLILGRPFLRRHGMVLDFQNNLVRVEKHDAVLYFQKDCDASLECLRLECSPEERDAIFQSIGGDISTKPQMQSVVEDFVDKGLFSSAPGQVNFDHEMYMKSDIPYRAPLRMWSKPKRDVLDVLLDKLLAQDIIEESSGEWSFAPVLVRKNKTTRDWDPKNFRLCIDYRPGNARAKVLPYDIPKLSVIFAQLSQAVVFSTIDCSMGYYQLGLRKSDRKYTAFSTPHRGAFQFKRLPMGISGAAYSFQRCIEKVLSGLLYKCCIAFQDDIVIYSSDKGKHADDVRMVLDRLHKAGFTINPSKVKFNVESCKLLGHVITPGKLHTDPEKLEAIREFPSPKSRVEVQRWLGLTGFYRSFIPNYAKICKPLFTLLKKDNSFVWSVQQEKSFELLKEALMYNVTVALPDLERDFVIATDGSYSGVGSVLMQDFGEGLRPIAWASRTLTPEEEGYCVTELEGVGLIYAIQKFYSYVETAKVRIITDHIALKALLSSGTLSGRLRRWAMKISGLSLEIAYGKGRYNYVADALSRAPITSATEPRISILDEIWPEECDPEFQLSFEKDFKLPPKEHDCRRCYCLQPNSSESRKKSPSRSVSPHPKRQKLFKKLQHQSTLVVPSNRELDKSKELECLVCEEADLPHTSCQWSLAQQKDDQLVAWKKEVVDNKKKNYFVDSDGVLRRVVSVRQKRYSKNIHQRGLVVVPGHLRGRVLEAFHSHPTASHGGLKVTLNRIQQRFCWKNMVKDCRDFIEGCLVCQEIKAPNHKPYGLMDSDEILSAGQVLSVDIIGPMPRSKAGNAFALVCRDEFTKFMEIYPMRSATAKVVALKLVDWTCRYGAYSQIKTDNGVQFQKVWEFMCVNLGIKVRKVTPFRPRGNGGVERLNREVKKAIKAVARENHATWDIALPAIAFHLRTLQHTATKFTPAFLTFGREISSIFDGDVWQGREGVKYPKFASELLTSLRQAWQVARENVRVSRQRQREQYNKGRQPHPFEVGQLVMRENNVLSNKAAKFAAGLASRFVGPYKIDQRLGMNTFVLVDLDGKKAGKWNSDQLKLFKSPPDWA